ncbi:SGNH/GDSL hydrolase family protein [Anaeromassilibacillus senegalensis]|uniref:SGNH/GDSL hydrolase family protein n=1 Tax=Anaeromassilibacillus senegalensis TaxID=1673717 RepID=UPI00067FDFDB|nr:SGNH/GDSL hydrolase family protein [Anaeromassilibacillus senegalensis]
MAEYITKIRTTDGDKQVDYNALANLPQALKNPNKLTFTGAVAGEYDGSKEVTVDIPVSGGSDWTFYSQTPCRLSGSSIGSVKLVSSETCDYRIYSDTVKNMDSAGRTFHWLTESHSNGVYEFTVSIVNNKPSGWYQVFWSMKFTDLEVGKAYKLYIDTTGLTPDSTTTGMNFGRFLLASVVNGTKSDPIINTTEVDHARLNSWEFTATTTDVLLEYYAGKEISELVNGYTVRFKDLYINYADAGSEHTPILNQSGSFTGEQVFPEYTDRLHYESTPSCAVYYSEAKSKLFTINGQEPDISGNIEIPVSRLQGRTLVCMGDSITGMFAPPADYPSVIARLTGMAVHNLGMEGCRMSHHTDQYYDAFSMYQLANAISTGNYTLQEAAVGHTTNYAANRVATLKAIDWSKVDYVTVLYGTNDVQGGVALDNAEDPKDTTTYLGAARYALEKLWMAYPNLKVLLLTPIYRYWPDASQDSDEKTFTGGKHLYEFGDGLIEVAKAYKTPAVDLYRKLGINKVNRSYYFPVGDGTHPNDLGRALLGEKIAGKFLSEF